jgi:hypothetical protein
VGGQRGKLLCVEDGFAVNQNHMAADAELWRGLRQLHGLSEGATVGHERRRSNDAAGVGFDNGAVHAGGVAEIIGVDDQATHPASVAARAGGTLRRISRC